MTIPLRQPIHNHLIDIHPFITGTSRSSSSTTMPPPLLPRKRKLPSPSPASTASSQPQDEDDEYRPSQPPRRTTGSTSTNPNLKSNGRTMSREQLRKQNHSLIERRRREKMNAALGELRSMVPGLGEEGGKGGEFKLEVSCVPPRLQGRS